MTSDFIPTQHPRDLDGKFAAKDGTDSGPEALAEDRTAVVARALRESAHPSFDSFTDEDLIALHTALQKADSPELYERMFNTKGSDQDAVDAIRRANSNYDRRLVRILASDVANEYPNAETLVIEMSDQGSFYPKLILGAGEETLIDFDVVSDGGDTDDPQYQYFEELEYTTMGLTEHGLWRDYAKQADYRQMIFDLDLKAMAKA